MLTPGVKTIELSNNRYPFMTKDEKNPGQKGAMNVVEYGNLQNVNVGSNAHDSSRAMKQEEQMLSQLGNAKQV